MFLLNGSDLNQTRDKLDRVTIKALAGIEQKRMNINIGTITMATKRPFIWKAFWILGTLNLLGNLAAIPLLQETGEPIESMRSWVLYTILALVLIAIGLFLAGRIGLGLPLLEGWLKRGERIPWLQRVVALSLIIAIAGSLAVLVSAVLDYGSEFDLTGQGESYLPLWTLLLASIKAAIQEEIFSRLFLMTLIAWLGSLVWREIDGRPTPAVLWTAIIISGLIFGWAHVDDLITNSEPLTTLLRVMFLNSLLGISFGWLYWKLGLESAILAHFSLDAVASVIVQPAYYSNNYFVWFGFIVASAVVLGISVRVLLQPNSRNW